MKDFMHCHVHTDYSMLDGLGKVEDYVDEAKRLGMSAMAVTDHGNMGAAPEFYWAARKAELEPVLGSEFYFVPDAEQVREDKDAERFHVGILAAGEEGVQILTMLSSESHRRFYYKPLLDRALLESLDPEQRSKLVVMSGCAASYISRLCQENLKEASKEIRWWKRLFPHFYMELQNHDTEFDLALNEKLMRLAAHHDVPIVLTNDPHYVHEEDASDHDALLCIQTASNIDDENRFRFDGSGYHLRSRSQMRRAFRQYPEWVWMQGSANTLAIADLCKTRIPAWESRTWRIPKFPDVDDAYGEVKRLAVEGLRKRTRGMEVSERRVYRNRVKRELRAFKEVGISDFLLITREVIEWAKSQGIPVGPGRGSVCGSLVAYLIGIHKMDSIRYNLLFERFLNVERPKMPDIDSDFAPSRRTEVFAHVEEKYGSENVLHVCAYNTMKLKSAFQALARSHGISYPQRLAISKMMGESSGHEEDEDSPLPPEMQAAFPDLAAQIEALLGTKRAISAHAAGVIIFGADDETRNLVPEQYIPSTKRTVAQYDLNSIEKTGWMKEDFLGLRTLETIDECLKLVRQRHGVDLVPDEWLPDEEERDDEVYRMLAEGRVWGVFQMEGGTNSRGIKEIACSCFEDIVACTSLYRKGPIDAGAPERFLNNKRDGEARVLHSSLKPILEGTWGEMIYQEQMMEILNKVAGFSMVEVDEVKEVVRKKDPVLMSTYKQKFADGCAANRIAKNTARRIWAMIETQSGYLFNRSHAVAYSFLTYQTARLKLLYPLEFTTALLRTVEKEEKRSEYLVEAAQNDFQILPPCVNLSDARSFPEGDRSIRLGLADIKGVGTKAVEKLLAARNGSTFESVMDVDEAVNNIGVVKFMREAGALACLGREADPERQEELLGWQFADVMAVYRRKYGRKVRLPEFNGQKCIVMGELIKIEKRNRRSDGVPFRIWKLRWAPGLVYDVVVGEDSRSLWKLEKGSIVVVRGKWKVSEYSSLSVWDPSQVTIVKEKINAETT